jgi:hypothetical protein
MDSEAIANVRPKRRRTLTPVRENREVADLDGVWKVVRTGGALPPLVAVRKEIDGTRGVTRIGPLPGVPFEVEGLRLRYRSPFSAFVDELEPVNDGFRGRATFRGGEFGRFVMRRISAAPRASRG